MHLEYTVLQCACCFMPASYFSNSLPAVVVCVLNSSVAGPSLKFFFLMLESRRPL